MEIADLLGTVRYYYGGCYRCGYCSEDYGNPEDAQKALMDSGWAIIHDELICGECQ